MHHLDPLISIITINYNDGNGLKETIQSVINQSYSNINYIVIDGGSTDNSLDIINSYHDKISCWVSEKDNGIYAAMNKGITLATGSYLLFLNSGDKLIDNDIIKSVVEFGLNHDLVYGDLLFFNKKKEWYWHIEEQLTFQTFYRSTIPHPATFIRKELFEKYGKYDEELKIVSDWKFFMLAIIKHKCSYKHINKVITAYNFEGLSSRSENFKTIEVERKVVLEAEFFSFVKDYERLNMLIAKSKKFKLFKNAKKAIKNYFTNHEY